MLVNLPGREKSAPKYFGQAVHEKEPRLRLSGAQLTNACGRKTPAGVGGYAKRLDRRIPECGHPEQLLPKWRNSREDRNTLAAKRFHNLLGQRRSLDNKSGSHI